LEKRARANWVARYFCAILTVAFAQPLSGGEEDRWGRVRELIDEREGNDAFSTPDSELPPKRGR
jgi:hypothetical protein